MKKFHLGKNGPAPCSVSPRSKRSCPLGGDHFDSMQEAEQAYQEKMESEYGETAPVKDRSRDLPHAEPVFEDRTIPYSPEEAPRDPNAKYAVLSDVDGTLTKGSLVLDHACYLHEKGVLNLGDLPQKWKENPKDEEVVGALADQYRRGIKGKTEEELGATDFVENYIQQDNKFYSTMRQLQEFKRRGWEIQLISGSPDYLVKPFANHFGFFGKGSTYHQDEEGRYTSEIDGMFGAEAKHEYVQKLDIPRFKRVLAFGDTVSDKPLFEHAQHTTLVDPTDETSAALPASLTIRE